MRSLIVDSHQFDLKDSSSKEKGFAKRINIINAKMNRCS